MKSAPNVHLPARRIGLACCFILVAAVAGAQTIGVLTPTFATYGLDPTTTFITPFVASQPGSVTTWKGNFVTGGSFPAGVQLKVFRQISGTEVQVVAVGQPHDPRGALQAISGYPNFLTDAGIVEFAENNVNMQAGDIIGLTVTPDANSQDYYTLVAANDSRGVLRDVASGETVNLSDPFTFTLAGEAPAILVSTAQNVTIDIKPGSDPNSINLSSAGVIPVAILSTSAFDARSIDPETLFLAGASVGMMGKSGKLLCHVEDVNGDGLPDLVCDFETAELLLQPGDTVAVLVGKTMSGADIRGQDTVRIVPQ